MAEEDSPKMHPPTDERATPEEWAAVENEMLKHDEGTMKDHLSDIDTLLVFAGLFSAVLTAFVIESYQQLQLDTGMGSMLVLQRISVQLESFTLSPGFANSSSLAPPLPSLNFVADSATRWINALWFLSLIFSLAAALFGILVKQWIREYMQWNYTLAPPRDNVLVRQIRFEAWNNWNVPATIASIPALLEIALVLFVCGLVILLWTLDPVVSIVITTAVAVFLAIASTFTILPSFFKRCPYKSPTAWACAVAWDFFTLWIPHAINRVQYRLGDRLDQSWRSRHEITLGRWLIKTSRLEKLRLKDWAPISRNWRARDLANVWSSFAPRSTLKGGDPTAFLDALLSEQSCADGGHECTDKQDSVLPMQYTPAGMHKDMRDIAKLPLHSALRTVTELPHLVRALAWVSQASQDAHTERRVSDCINSLNLRFILPEPMILTRYGHALTQEGVRALSIWHLLVTFSRRNELVTTLAIEDEVAYRVSIAKSSMYPRLCDHHGNNTRVPYKVFHSHVLSPAEDSQAAISILISLSILSSRDLLKGLVTLHPDSDTRSTLRGGRRAVELLAMLHSFYNTNRSAPYHATAGNSLADILVATSGVERQSFEAKFPSLRESILDVMRHFDPRWRSSWAQVSDSWFGGSALGGGSMGPREHFAGSIQSSDWGVQPGPSHPPWLTSLLSDSPASKLPTQHTHADGTTEVLGDGVEVSDGGDEVATEGNTSSPYALIEEEVRSTFPNSMS